MSCSLEVHKHYVLKGSKQNERQTLAANLPGSVRSTCAIQREDRKFTYNEYKGKKIATWKIVPLNIYDKENTARHYNQYYCLLQQKLHSTILLSLYKNY